MVMKSHEIGAVTNTYPLVPLWIPQVFVGIGFSILAFTAIHMIVDMAMEAVLPVLHRMQGGTETYRIAASSRSVLTTEESSSAV